MGLSVLSRMLGVLVTFVTVLFHQLSRSTGCMYYLFSCSFINFGSKCMAWQDMVMNKYIWKFDSHVTLFYPSFMEWPFSVKLDTLLVWTLYWYEKTKFRPFYCWRSFFLPWQGWNTQKLTTCQIIVSNIKTQTKLIKFILM